MWKTGRPDQQSAVGCRCPKFRGGHLRTDSCDRPPHGRGTNVEMHKEHSLIRAITAAGRATRKGIGAWEEGGPGQKDTSHTVSVDDCFGLWGRLRVAH